jgi:mannose-6-phosphate isomerase-like protein (cupin superfamily)
MEGDTKPGKRFSDFSEGNFVLKELFNQENCNLDFLSLCLLKITDGVSPCMAYPKEEVLLFLLEGEAAVEVDGLTYELSHYDVLYIPVGTGFRLLHRGTGPAVLYAYRAVGDKKFPVYFAKWKDVRHNKDRIRKLNKKLVYIMLDVGEQANKFVAGYTFYEPETRAWPPHNHTDQEECYSFIEGRGAMSVYPDDEHMTYVTSVNTGDHITIPVMNYHPVFSQDQPLTFIWCIAGERYWVGDKNKDFMTAKVSKLTT